MNGINVPELVYKFLSEDEELSNLIDVDNNIVPLMTPPTNFPFIMFKRESVDPIYTKDGLSEDLVRIRITVVDTDYYNACNILSNVRRILEYKSFKDENFYISLITVDGIYEDYAENSFIQTIDIDFKIQY